MAFTTINKSGDYFNTKLYSGNGGTNAITGVGFQPDWVWLKHRNGSTNHNIFDALRGVQKLIEINTGAEQTTTDKLSAFGTDGFTLGSNGGINASGGTYASWNWIAGATQSLGGGVTSTVKANTTSGFSIVSWTGTAGNILVSHGLGAVPKMIIVKNRSITQEWAVYHASLGPTKFLELNQSAAESSNSNRWNNSSPDATHFIVSSDASVNGNGNAMIAYCFAEKTGYSKFGSYVGNGSTDGTFIYTGFKPAFIVMKSSSNSSRNWKMFDNKRDPNNNDSGNALNANDASAEDDNSAYDIDFLSNGFKQKNTNANMNNSGETYIFMAFAEAPLVGTNNIPATAR